jgi:hypothetical protein
MVFSAKPNDVKRFRVVRVMHFEAEGVANEARLAVKQAALEILVGV